MTYVKVLKKILVNARMIILVNYKYYRKYKIEVYRTVYNFKNSN